MASFESTNEWTWMDLSALAAHEDRRSHHVFSEPHLRGEVWHFREGEAVGPLKIEGNLLLLGLAGSVSLKIGDDSRSLGRLCEIILNPGTSFLIFADSKATIQLVWSPPFAPVHRTPAR